ncbi:MAG TPA: hypothetical protein PLL10_10070, partial [Elusimicrobiales bacterium]|nr:hypothetical protein [Elusimicrobiales bacterium]
GFLAVFLLLSMSMLQDIGVFSFTHDRIFVMYMSFAVFCFLEESAASGEYRWHLPVFAGLGVLAGSSMSSVIPIVMSLALCLSSFTLLRGRLKFYGLCGVVMTAVACCFPLWNYVNTGALLPTAFALNGKTKISESLISPINMEIWASYFKYPDVSFLDYALYAGKYLFTEFGFAASLFLSGFWFFKRQAMRRLYFYAFGSFFFSMALFKLILGGGVHNRFLLGAVPFLIALLSISFSLTRDWFIQRLDKHKAKRPIWVLAVALFLLFLGNAWSIYRAGLGIADRAALVFYLNSPLSQRRILPFYVEATVPRRNVFDWHKIGDDYLAAYYLRLRSWNNNAEELTRIFSPPFTPRPHMLAFETYKNRHIGSVGFSVAAEDLQRLDGVKIVLGGRARIFQAPEISQLVSDEW